MPRSYSFDHFTAAKPDPSKVETATGTHHPVKSETPMPEQQGLHYGRQHAQTVARLQARRMDREAAQQLEELTRMMDEQPPLEPVEAAESPPAEAERAAPRRQATRAKRAPSSKRAAAKKSTVARRSTSARKAAGSRKKAPARPARKAATGAKKVARKSAMARTARGGKRRTAKTPAARGTSRRAPKRR